MLIFLALPIVSGWLLPGCTDDPDRDNPADPGSDQYYDAGLVEILTVNRNDAILAWIPVHVEQTDEWVVTDETGRGSIVLDPGSYTLAAGLPGYSSVIDSFDLTARGEITRRLQLNAYPVLDSVKVTTYREHDQVTIERIFINNIIVQAWGKDEDEAPSDLEVLVQDPFGSSYDTLTYRGNGRYEIVFDFGPTGKDSLLDRIEQPFRITITDGVGASAEQTGQIPQMYEYNLLYDDMITSGTVADSPVVHWWFPEGPELYPRRYSVDVFLNDQETLLADTVVVNVDSVWFPVDWSEWSLTTLYWQLTLYDTYGNAIRSHKRSLSLN